MNAIYGVWFLQYIDLGVILGVQKKGKEKRKKKKEKRKKKREHDMGGGLLSKLLTHHIWILPAKIPLHALTPAPTNQKQKREERFI
jgi:hypothetical protein